MPPIGRIKKPTPKVAVVFSRASSSLSSGKNNREMITVRNPKTTKSYHSSALPITAAITCLRWVAGIAKILVKKRRRQCTGDFPTVGPGPGLVWSGNGRGTFPLLMGSGRVQPRSGGEKHKVTRTLNDLLADRRR